MFQLYANVLCEFVRDLSAFEFSASGLQKTPTTKVSASDQALTTPLLEACDRVTGFLWMPATAARRTRLAAVLEAGCTYTEIGTQLRVLREAVEDDLKGLLVLYMPPGQAVHYYAGESLLGKDVVGQFPQCAGDIDEAGKCLGSGRFTAAVFHLMRVMEAGVQAFGQKLGIMKTDEKVWQMILNEANSAIDGLQKGPEKVAMSELAALLHAVKVAWRNEVMHPKATYTEEEADNVRGATKAFMSKLAGVV